MDFRAGLAQGFLGFGRYGERAGICRFGKLIEVIGEARFAQLAQQLAENLMILDGPLSPAPVPGFLSFEDLGPDIGPKGHVARSLFERGPLLER
jgi:hypothetical protein